jgi:hypothetical protein
VALDYENTRRGYRYVVFDVFGHVVSRVSLEECERTSNAAYAALQRYLNTVDPQALTLEALERVERRFADETATLRAKLAPAVAA